eukprot:Protomagalhaensia_sp_Gyna_25__80@NODE_1040_length_2258_cov_3_028391_g829_i0_p3_GENE_NODE_1040_length_2258_cov_3_028391_g829_i0NODE_1040_length_2258_cov_3_028391_g829_i0_p3_ORF_typecomplete_len122_score2_00Polysacc_deac_2/PF04748_13/0_0097_NODE_1040_length_2258_cov_3_028391_g829_i011611526
MTRMLSQKQDEMVNVAKQSSTSSGSSALRTSLSDSLDRSPCVTLFRRSPYVSDIIANGTQDFASERRQFLLISSACSLGSRHLALPDSEGNGLSRMAKIRIRIKSNASAFSRFLNRQLICL